MQPPNKRDIIIICMGIMAASVGFMYFNAIQKNIKDDIKINFNNTRAKPDQGTESTQSAPYHPGPDTRNNIAKICVNKKNASQSNIQPGAIQLVFKDNLSANQIKKIMIGDGFTDFGNYFLDDPTQVEIIWNETFEKQNAITLEEINSFIQKVRHEPYIENLQVGSGWRNNSYYEAATSSLADVVDRWNYFTLTFKDPTKKMAFLEKYPQATLFSNDSSSSSGIGYILKDPRQMVILYKAQNAIQILQAIIKEGRLMDFPIYIDFEHNKVREQEMVDISDDRRDEASKRYIATLNMKFPSNFDTEQINQLLGKHSAAIDIDKTKPDIRINNTSIPVPVGEEECWAKELEKNPAIDVAAPMLRYGDI